MMIKVAKSFKDLGAVYLNSRKEESKQEATSMNLDLPSFLRSVLKSVYLDEDVIFSRCIKEGYLYEDIEDELMALVANGIVLKEKVRSGNVSKSKYRLADISTQDPDNLDEIINGNKLTTVLSTAVVKARKTVSSNEEKLLALEWIDHAIYESTFIGIPRLLTDIVESVQAMTKFDLPEFTRGLINERFNDLYRRKWFDVTMTPGCPSKYSLKPSTVPPSLTSLKLLKLKKESETKQSPSKENIMAATTAVASETTTLKFLPIDLVKEWMEFAIWFVLNRDTKLRIDDLAREVFTLVDFQNGSHWNQAKIADKVIMLMKKKYIKSKASVKTSAPFYLLASFPKPKLTDALLISAFNEATGAKLPLPDVKVEESITQLHLTLAEEVKQDPTVPSYTFTDFSKDIIAYLDSKVIKTAMDVTLISLMVEKNYASKDAAQWLMQMVEEGKLSRTGAWITLLVVEKEVKDPSKEPVSKNDTFKQAVWKITSDGQWYTAADIGVLLKAAGCIENHISSRISPLHREGWFEKANRSSSSICSYRLLPGIPFPEKHILAKTYADDKTAIRSFDEIAVTFPEVKETKAEIPADHVVYPSNEKLSPEASQRFVDACSKFSDGVKSLEKDFKLEDLGPAVQALITPDETMSPGLNQQYMNVFETASNGINASQDAQVVFERFTKDVEEVLSGVPLPFTVLCNRLAARNHTLDYCYTNISVLACKRIVLVVNGGTAYTLAKRIIPAQAPISNYPVETQPSFPSIPLIEVKTNVKGISLTNEQVTQLVAEAALLVQSLEYCKLLSVKVELRGIYLTCDELKEIVRALG